MSRFFPTVERVRQARAAMLDQANGGAAGFVVLVPVTVDGKSHVTPVLVDADYGELAFTSHPEYGAGIIPPEVLPANPRLLLDVREELLGVVATWHGTDEDGD